VFKPVTTKYNLATRDLESYIANKIKNAKDITKVFKNLEKQGYTITTVETSFMHSKAFNTEIGGIFNGNARVLNVIWQDIPNEYEAESGCKQEICLIIK